MTPRGKRVLKWLGIGAGGLGLVVAGLVGYAAFTADGKMRFPDAPYPDLHASEDPELIERGRYLVHGPAHCIVCHSTAERDFATIEGTPLHGGLEFAMGPLGTRYAANLTPAGIGERTDAELARAIRSGVLHDGELSFLMLLAGPNPADEDIVAILSYLRSLEPVEWDVPKGEWYLFGKVLITYAFPPMKPRSESPTYVPAAAEPSLERGRYLADSVMLCTTCHTAMDPATFELIGEKAAGSLPDPSHGDDDDMEFVAPNLTSHATGVTGKLDEEAFVARMKAGRGYPSSIMPWEGIINTTESDLRSVYRYLKSLPPIDNDVGPTYRKKGSHED